MWRLHPAAWGQYDTVRVTQMAMKMDPSRIYDCARCEAHVPPHSPFSQHSSALSIAVEVCCTDDTFQGKTHSNSCLERHQLVPSVHLAGMWRFYYLDGIQRTLYAVCAPQRLVRL